MIWRFVSSDRDPRTLSNKVEALIAHFPRCCDPSGHRGRRGHHSWNPSRHSFRKHCDAVVIEPSLKGENAPEQVLLVSMSALMNLPQLLDNLRSQVTLGHDAARIDQRRRPIM
jgi:hypothetical protein